MITGQSKIAENTLGLELQARHWAIFGTVMRFTATVDAFLPKAI
jgi:hypothetical protein